MVDPLLLMATVVFTLFAFAFGACFGSFLNVVVWRMPRRMPIVWARSHCPKCKHEILGQDNIPIFGWLRLRGKCRFCGLPISIQYPLIEAAVGLLCAGLFVLIVVSHGSTLPAGWMTDHFANWLTEFPHCPLLVVYLHQFVLGYFLLAFALIDEDHMPAPWSLLMTALLFHCGLVLANPAINQMDLLSQTAQAGELQRATWAGSFRYSGYGMLMGMLLGGLAWWRKAPHVTVNSLQALLLIGCFVGPIVVLWAGLIGASSLLVQLVSERFPTRKKTIRSGLPLQLLFAWILILCSWRWWPPFPFPAWL